jgi:hypothetical protein
MEGARREGQHSEGQRQDRVAHAESAAKLGREQRRDRSVDTERADRELGEHQHHHQLGMGVLPLEAVMICGQ